MTSLVNSLVDEENPLSAESVQSIDITNVIEDIKGIYC